MDWIEIDRDSFITAVKILNLVPQRAGIPSSDYVRVTLEKNRIELAMSSSVTGMSEIKLKEKVLPPGQFFIDRRMLLPFILAGGGWKSGFKMLVEEGRWLLKQGSRRAELSMKKEPIGGYGKWRDLSEMKELTLSEELKKMLVASGNCATADPALQHLNCIYIAGRQVVASNQTLIFLGMTKKEDQKAKFPFPIGVVPLLSESLVKGVSIEGEIVILDCGSGYLEGTVSAHTQKFPLKVALEQVEKARALPIVGKLPAERFAKVLDRLTDYLSGMKREDRVINLEMGDGKIKISVSIAQGSFHETIESEEAKKEVSLQLPLDEIKSVVNYMKELGETITLKTQIEKQLPYLMAVNGVELLIAAKIKK